MMVRHLMAKKFNALAGVEPLNLVAMPKPQKTVHAHFRLINCLFSNELSAQADIAGILLMAQCLLIPCISLTQQ